MSRMIPPLDLKPADSKESTNTENEFVLVNETNEENAIYNLCVTEPMYPLVEDEEPFSDESGMSTECSVEVPCSGIEDEPTAIAENIAKNLVVGEGGEDTEKIFFGPATKDESTTFSGRSLSVTAKSMLSGLLRERTRMLENMEKEVICREGKFQNWYIKRRSVFIKFFRLLMENVAMAIVYLEVNFLRADCEEEEDEEEEIDEGKEIDDATDNKDKLLLASEDSVSDSSPPKTPKKCCLELELMVNSYVSKNFFDGIFAAVLVPVLGLGLMGLCLYVTYLNNQVAFLQDQARGQRMAGEFRVHALRKELEALRKNSSSGTMKEEGSTDSLALVNSFPFKNRFVKPPTSETCPKSIFLGKFANYNEIPNQTGAYRVFWGASVREPRNLKKEENVLAYLMTPRNTLPKLNEMAPLPNMSYGKNDSYPVCARKPELESNFDVMKKAIKAKESWSNGMADDLITAPQAQKRIIRPTLRKVAKLQPNFRARGTRQTVSYEEHENFLSSYLRVLDSSSIYSGSNLNGSSRGSMKTTSSTSSSSSYTTALQVIPEKKKTKKRRTSSKKNVVPDPHKELGMLKQFSIFNIDPKFCLPMPKLNQVSLYHGVIKNDMCEWEDDARKSLLDNEEEEYLNSDLFSDNYYSLISEELMEKFMANYKEEFHSNSENSKTDATVVNNWFHNNSTMPYTGKNW